MSSRARSTEKRSRKGMEDAAVFGAATVGAVYTTLTMGVLGLAIGCMLLSVAVSVVVWREDGVHDPADQPTTDERILADGGRDE